MRGVDLFRFQGAGEFALIEAVGNGLAVGGDFLVGRVRANIEAFGGNQPRFGDWDFNPDTSAAPRKTHLSE